MPDMREGRLGDCRLLPHGRTARPASRGGKPFLGRGLAAHGRLRGDLVQKAPHASQAAVFHQAIRREPSR